MHRNQTGITLIELLITVGILAILMAIGIPSFQDFFSTNKIATATGDFQSALSLARSEAVRRGQEITLARNGGAAKNWDGGWTMYQDADGDGVADAGEILRVGGQVASNVSLRSNATFQDDIVFAATGRVTGGGNGSFFVCHDNDAAHGRSIVILGTGRIRVTDVASNGNNCAP